MFKNIFYLLTEQLRMTTSSVFDLLIAKLYAYGFSEKSAVFLYSYLKRRKQNVKIDDILSTFQSLISGVPQGSILGPILFNIFLNDLLTTLENSEIYNFADDNTISSISKEKQALLTTLEKDSEKVLFGLGEII